MSPLVARASLVGQVSPSQVLHLTFFLSPRNQQQLGAQAREALRTHTPTLSKEEFLAQHAPNEADYATLASFVNAPGVSVGRMSNDRTTLQVSASVSTVEALLGTTINTYQLNGRQFFANATNPELPRALAGKVTHISGLDDAAPYHKMSGPLVPQVPASGSADWMSLATRAHPTPPRTSNLAPRVTRATPAAAWPKPKPRAVADAGASPYAPSDIQTAYDVTPLLNAGFDGTGQTIGVVTLADYTQSDIRQFETAFGLPQASITQVGSAPLSPDYCNADGITESDLDVEWSTAMAPGAAVKVFEAGNCDLPTAISEAVTDGSAKFVSISWGACEPSQTASAVTAIHNSIASGVAEGISFFVASGDNGASDCGWGLGPAVDFPASDPNVTAVGGTSLSLGTYNTAPSPAAPGAWMSESGWSESGGGCSTLFAEPQWQIDYTSATGANLGCGTSFSGAAGRAVPDVAANAGPPYAVYDSYGFDVVGGTSVAAPVWAGIVASMQTRSSAAGVTTASTAFTTAVLYHSGRVQGTGTGIGPKDVHDIIDGSNGLAAAANWDPVTGLGSPDATALFTHEFGGTLPAPANDNFANAVPLTTLPALEELSTTSATTQMGEPSPICETVSNTVWYSITTDPNATSLTISAVGSTFGAVAALWSGSSLSGLTEIGCFPASGPSSSNSLSSLTVSPFTTYYVQVGGSPSGDGGGLQLSISQTCGGVACPTIAAPTNDDFVNAQTFSAPTMLSGTTIGATHESGEPLSCTDSYGSSWSYDSTVWLKFTPSQNETLVFSPADTAPGSRLLAVWTGSAISSLSQQACFPYFPYFPVAIPTAANTTYYLQLGGLYGESGGYQFQVAYVLPQTSFIVNTTSDVTDHLTGACSENIAGQCSLREALLEATTAGIPAATVTLSAGTYALNPNFSPLCVPWDSSSATSPQVTISGAGASSTFIDGQHANGVLGVYSGTANVNGVTIENGRMDYGGSMYNAATLTISNSVLSGGTADDGPGGALYNVGALTLANVTFSGNTAQQGGGAIVTSTASITGSTFTNNSAPGTGASGGAILDLSAGSAFGLGQGLTISGSTFRSNAANSGGGALSNMFGVMTIDTSTIDGNAASGVGAQGGGIFNDGNLSLTGSTVSNNRVSGSLGQGAGIFNESSLTLSNSTIFGNASSGTSGIGGLYNDGGTSTISYSTIAGNDLGILNDSTSGGAFSLKGTIISQTPGGLGADCNALGAAGTITDGGYNLADDTSCALTAATSRNGVSARLASGLASNGGPTQTLALLTGSPAIDAGGSSANGCPTTDQRGIARPQGTACDIGAFELVPAPPSPTATSAPSSGGTAPPPSSAPPAPSQDVTTLVGQQAATALSNAGVSVVIPPVATSAASAVVADVPVPLAPLQNGALVLPENANLTQTVLTQVLTAPAPVPVSAAINPNQGGVVVAGNVAVSLPPAALTGLVTPGAPGQPAAPANVAVNISTQPQNVITPGGPAQFSPNGTILDISITNASTGQPITTFPAPVPVVMKYNAADVGQANGDPNLLTAAYIIDANSPDLENPMHFPIGTFVLFPPSATTLDTTSGTITVQTQAIGSVLSVVTNPVGYVQTTASNAPELSSFNTSDAQTFGTKPQFSYLQVVEPQIGTTLLVRDPDTGNYAYVNASDVGPSGPPSGNTATAVVRGLLQGQ